MKKLCVLIMSMIISANLMACNKKSEEAVVKEEPKQEIKIYCAKCGSESNELKKVCSVCEEETTWAVEKPEIIKEEEEVKETQNEDKDDSEEETTSNEKKGTCAICGKQDSLDNLEHLHGIGYTVHISCLESYPTCQNCGNSLFEFESDTPGICFSCGN